MLKWISVSSTQFSEGCSQGSLWCSTLPRGRRFWLWQWLWHRSGRSLLSFLLLVQLLPFLRRVTEKGIWDYHWIFRGRIFVFRFNFSEDPKWISWFHRFLRPLLSPPRLMRLELWACGRGTMINYCKSNELEGLSRKNRCISYHLFSYNLSFLVFVRILLFHTKRSKLIFLLHYNERS